MQNIRESGGKCKPGASVDASVRKCILFGKSPVALKKPRAPFIARGRTVACWSSFPHSSVRRSNELRSWASAAEPRLRAFEQGKHTSEAARRAGRSMPASRRRRAPNLQAPPNHLVSGHRVLLSLRPENSGKRLRREDWPIFRDSPIKCADLF